MKRTLSGEGEDAEEKRDQTLAPYGSQVLIPVYSWPDTGTPRSAPIPGFSNYFVELSHWTVGDE